MNKTIISLVIAGMMMLFSAGSAMAHEEATGDTYKAVEKETHLKAFPQGHPVTRNSLNRCFWDEKDGLFFCQYPLKEGVVQ